MKNGTATVSFNFHEAETVAISATAGSLTGSTSIVVVAGPPVKIIATPSLQTETLGKKLIHFNDAGEGFKLTVAAQDEYGNATSARALLAGSLTVTCNGKHLLENTPFTVDPSNSDLIWSTVSIGQVLSSVYLKVTSHETLTGGFNLNTSSAVFQILSAMSSVTQYAITTPTNPVTLGQSFPITITAENAQGGGVNEYCTVNLTSYDGQAVSPSTFSFTGSGTFNVTLGIGQSSWNPRNEETAILSPTQLAATDASGVFGQSPQITVNGDPAGSPQLSEVIPDVVVQDDARTDLQRDGTLTYDDMLGIFQDAENELQNLAVVEQNRGDNGWANGAENTLVTSLRHLVTANFTMPADVHYLADMVTSSLSAGDSPDLSFLAQYYYYSAATWTVTLTDPAAGGDYWLCVNGALSGTIPANATAVQVQTALQNCGWSMVGNLVTVTGASPGVYNVVFADASGVVDPYLRLSNGVSLLNGDCVVEISNTVNPTPAIPVYAAGGGPAFGNNNGPQGVVLSAETTALVNQWFLGTVEPNSYLEDQGDNYYVAPSDYSQAEGGLFGAPYYGLFGPTGGPLVTDVHHRDWATAGCCRRWRKLPTTTPA